jgi:hypothetical protein
MATEGEIDHYEILGEITTRSLPDHHEIRGESASSQTIDENPAGRACKCSSRRLLPPLSYQVCVYHEENPAGRAVNFDSVIDASMAIVQTITFDTWSDVMYDLMEAFSWYVLMAADCLLMAADCLLMAADEV